MLKDTSGERSLTATAFIIGFSIVNIKFLLSGLTIAGTTFTVLTGIEYASALSGLGAIYIMRRHLNGNKNTN